MTPGRLKAIIRENVGDNHPDMDEEDMMIMILAQVFGFDASLIENLILKQPGLENKLQGLRAVVANMFDKEVDIEAMEQLVSRRAKQAMKMYQHYAASAQYQGKIILIKTTQNLIEFDSNSKFWGIDEVREKLLYVLI